MVAASMVTVAVAVEGAVEGAVEAAGATVPAFSFSMGLAITAVLLSLLDSGGKGGGNFPLGKRQR